MDHGEKSKFNAEIVEDKLWMLNAQVLVAYSHGSIPDLTTIVTNDAGAFWVGCRASGGFDAVT